MCEAREVEELGVEADEPTAQPVAEERCRGEAEHDDDQHQLQVVAPRSTRFAVAERLERGDLLALRADQPRQHDVEQERRHPEEDRRQHRDASTRCSLISLSSIAVRGLVGAAVGVAAAVGRSSASSRVDRRRCSDAPGASLRATSLKAPSHVVGGGQRRPVDPEDAEAPVVRACVARAGSRRCTPATARCRRCAAALLAVDQGAQRVAGLEAVRLGEGLGPATSSRCRARGRSSGRAARRQRRFRRGGRQPGSRRSAGRWPGSGRPGIVET